jgi:riboflavin kinase/FMN adenylyltransferase
MELIRGRYNLRPGRRGCAVTIGAFDGVHRGHQAVLAHLRDEAEARNLDAVAITFEPLPREYFAPNDAPPRLMGLRDKVVAMREQGVDRLLCLRFNEALRRMSAREFVEAFFVRGLGARYIVLGDDFRFGNDREGDINYLRSVSEEFGFSVEPTPTFALSGDRVSSTRVRSALAEGDFALAAQLLGRPYCISGRVTHGRRLGRELNSPTANIALRRSNTPISGVFAVSVTGAGLVDAPGVANLGVKPTIASDLGVSLEVHLLDRKVDLYGKRLAVRFLHKLRDEQKFASLDALKAGIAADQAAAREWHRANHGESHSNINHGADGTEPMSGADGIEEHQP